MRYRYGFVSNSSSSSFCIYGVNLKDYDDKYDFDAIMKKFECEDDYELDTKFENEGLYVSHGPDGEGFYVGRQWRSIGDDETGADLKGEVQLKLNDIVGKEVKCSTIQEEWRDG